MRLTIIGTHPGIHGLASRAFFSIFGVDARTDFVQEEPRPSPRGWVRGDEKAETGARLATPGIPGAARDSAPHTGGHARTQRTRAARGGARFSHPQRGAAARRTVLALMLLVANYNL